MPTAREIELLRAARTSGIQSREELANFMAQVTHESSDLTDLEEGFRYTRGIDQIPVRSAFRQGREILETARVQALNGRKTGVRVPFPKRYSDFYFCNPLRAPQCK